jgi:hypothetical protein
MKAMIGREAGEDLASEFTKLWLAGQMPDYLVRQYAIRVHTAYSMAREGFFSALIEMLEPEQLSAALVALAEAENKAPHQTTIRLSTTLMAEIDVRAHAKGITRNEWIRRAVEAAIDWEVQNEEL